MWVRYSWVVIVSWLCKKGKRSWRKNQLLSLVKTNDSFQTKGYNNEFFFYFVCYLLFVYPDLLSQKGWAEAGEKGKYDKNLAARHFFTKLRLAKGKKQGYASTAFAYELWTQLISYMEKN